MTIQLNGKKVNLPGEISSIRELLAFYKLENQILVVELNKEIAYKEQYSTQLLSDGDMVEIVHFVGGG
ncbi:sulfur carrier protein ThiS [Peribacillus cavernae]|uniref:Sulfur carrier protein ThiS n=1 Tax=Peribacillus cavernae TaxID=1674310 RepID=A0A433HK60_9BACI|nr:sulfur carrier protein ThiS [Peribacillus cavernae]MDQ0220179.1 sulfur carrier protein [Peribacillus cavernae]RUQ28804.1 sulfur carrier protein ThiS [Peribacillus cavernae]